VEAYRTSEEDAHTRDEYLQWSRILSRGNPVHGMLLVFMQKLCTAFHELGPAWEEGVLDDRAFDSCRPRLAARAQTLLDTFTVNGLGTVDVAIETERMLETIGDARTMKELAGLAEPVHQLGHHVCDWLERQG